MKKRSPKKTPSKITLDDFMKAVKKADRETEQSFRPGWASRTKVHKNKKAYDRKQQKRVKE
jgi:hypothetical protein